MTMPISLGGAEMASALRTGKASEQERLREVAQQFEAIFLRQMLSAARGADFGGDDLFGSQGEETFREMRDAHFADVAAGTGMVGFARSIEAQLAAHIRPADSGNGR